jgi:pyroglutamyl-peptidase
MEAKNGEFKVLSPSMPDYENVEVHITGFGKFLGVDVNPTTILVSKLEEYLKSHPIEKLKLGSKKIVVVSSVDAVQAVDELVHAAIAAGNKAPKTKQLLLHFGVAAGNPIFNIENKAYNGAHFPDYPDERGYRPDNEPIIKGIAYNHPLETIVPCADLVFNLQSSGQQVDLSDNPGAFICNYIYYTSLYKTLPLRIPSLFVHVPSFETIPEAKQFEFVHALLSALRDLYTES